MLSGSLSPPGQLPLWRALLGPAEHSPAVGQSLSTGNEVSAPRERISTWLLFCVSKEQLSYSSRPNIPSIRPIQFYKNLSSIFCVSNQLPPTGWRTEHWDLFFYLDWAWGIFFHWQHTYKMQGTSSVLFPVLYGIGMWLLLLVYISKLSYNQSTEIYVPGRKEIGPNVIRGTLTMKGLQDSSPQGAARGWKLWLTGWEGLELSAPASWVLPELCHRTEPSAVDAETQSRAASSPGFQSGETRPNSVRFLSTRSGTI